MWSARDVLSLMAPHPDPLPANVRKRRKRGEGETVLIPSPRVSGERARVRGALL